MADLIYLNPAFLINKKLTDGFAELVSAISTIREGNLAFQTVINDGGFDNTNVETAAAHPLVNTGGIGTGQAVHDVVVSVLAALDDPNIADKIKRIYQGG